MNALETVFTPGRRRWLYRIAAAALALLGVYGVLNANEADALLLLFAALFGLADAKTPAAPDYESRDE